MVAFASYEDATYLRESPESCHLSLEVFQDPKMGTAPSYDSLQKILIAMFRGRKTFISRKLRPIKKNSSATIEKVGNGLE